METRKEDIKQFAQAFGPLPIRTSPQTMEPTRSERQTRLQSRVREIREMMRRIGDRPATVIYMRPYPFQAQGIHSCNYPLPSCEIGTLYTKKVIPGYELDVYTSEMGQEDVKEVLAIDIADDIKQQLNSQKPGKRGVIVYMGDRDPEKYAPDSYNPEQRDIMAEIKAEKEALIAELTQYVEEAEKYWTDSDRASRKYITELHRTAARYLLNEKRLKDQPDWYLDTRTAGQVVEPCPDCGTEPMKGAMSCKVCGWILDPKKAYELGKIGPEDASLMRLSREDLNKLGLKDIPTLSEFRKAQKSATAGR